MTWPLHKDNTHNMCKLWHGCQHGSKKSALADDQLRSRVSWPPKTSLWLAQVMGPRGTPYWSDGAEPWYAAAAAGISRSWRSYWTSSGSGTGGRWQRCGSRCLARWTRWWCWTTWTSSGSSRGSCAWWSCWTSSGSCSSWRWHGGLASVHEMVVYGELSEQARALVAAAGAGTGVSQSMHEAAVLGDPRLQDRALALGAGWVPVQGAIPPISLMRLADEQLDDLIRQQMMADDFLMQNRIDVSPPALRSMRIEGGLGGSQQNLMAGLSPDQQRWLLQATESMRGQQTPPPRQRALTDGEAERRREIRAGGSLLGPLALPDGHQPKALVLRPLDLPAPLDGVMAAPMTSPAPAGLPIQYGPTAPAPIQNSVPPMNAFWSDRVQNEANGIVVPAPEVPRQSADGLAGIQIAEQTAPAPENRVMAGDGTLSHQDLIEFEALRAQAVRDVEARVRQEAQRRRDQQVASRTGSFHSAVDGNGGNGGNIPQGGGGSALPSQAGLSPLLPPGVGQSQHGLLSQQVGHAGLPQHGRHLPQGGQGLSGGQVPRAPQQPPTQPPHFGETLNESLRSLELPKIPQDCSALDFGDWLAVVGPLMADLSGSSSQWWALVLAAANEAYARWQVSTPLERLRLRVVFPLDIYRWPRTEQRAVTMLLAAVPDGIRRAMIASRKLNSMDILFTLLCRFQPGGASERASLLRDISDPQLKQNANVQDFLTALRQWRRNLGRPVELGLQLPDPLILVNLLTRWADHLGRLGGAQLGYRMAFLRQQLQLETMPNSTSVVEFAEALQSRSRAACFVRAEHCIDLDDDLGFELYGVCGENQEGASEGCRSSSWGGLSKKGWRNHKGQASLLGNSCWMQTCWWM